MRDESMWDEELTLKMTRGAWADLIDGKPIGTCRAEKVGVIRVFRHKEVVPEWKSSSHTR